LAAGIGEAIGEFTGYLAGRTGHAFFIKSRFQDIANSKGVYPGLQRWVKTRGSLALFVSSAVFNPFFEHHRRYGRSSTLPLVEVLPHSLGWQNSEMDSRSCSGLGNPIVRSSLAWHKALAACRANSFV
jgi:hypothetical protein